MKQPKVGRDKDHHGRKVEAVRWSVRSAAIEFDSDQATLHKRLRNADILPGADDCYSTKNIVDALFGGLTTKIKEAQLEDLKQSAQLKQARKGNLLKANIPVEMVEKVWGDFMVDLRQKITNLDLPPAKRSEILADLQNINAEDYFKGLNKDEEKEVESDPD